MAFIDDSEDKIRVKTKNLLQYDLLIEDNYCSVITKGQSTLETRSIFKLGDKYHDQFEQLKHFIDLQEKSRGIVCLPDANIKIVGGYCEMT
jgi:hypothetical protein